MSGRNGTIRGSGRAPILGALLLALAAAGCSSGSGPSVDPREKTDEGWAAFESGDYAAAAAAFQDAVRADEAFADAWNGLGWSRAFLEQLGDAAMALQKAVDSGLVVPDARAGLAIVYREVPHLDGAITEARAVLAADAHWVFSHMTSVDYLDIHLVLAQCYYRLGEENFGSAQAQLDILDPDNGLDAGDPGSWTVGSATYGTYAEALLVAIEQAAAAVGGGSTAG
ncbi:MAG: tetratricopeptide repeat protein [bacterium]